MSQPDPHAMLRAFAKRLEDRAFAELEASRDDRRDDLDKKLAGMRAVACQVVGEELLLVLTEPW
jgi:hypothetical protein